MFIPATRIGEIKPLSSRSNGQKRTGGVLKED